MSTKAEHALVTRITLSDLDRIDSLAKACGLKRGPFVAKLLTMTLDTVGQNIPSLAAKFAADGAKEASCSSAS